MHPLIPALFGVVKDVELADKEMKLSTSFNCRHLECLQGNIHILSFSKAINHTE